MNSGRRIGSTSLAKAAMFEYIDVLIIEWEGTHAYRRHDHAGV